MPFQTGDVVKYVGKDKYWATNETHIIYEVAYRGNNRFQYSTNRGAWFEQTDFQLVHKATKESLNQLDKDIEADNEEC